MRRIVSEARYKRLIDLLPREGKNKEDSKGEAKMKYFIYTTVCICFLMLVNPVFAELNNIEKEKVKSLILDLPYVKQEIKDEKTRREERARESKASVESLYSYENEDYAFTFDYIQEIDLDNNNQKDILTTVTYLRNLGAPFYESSALVIIKDLKSVLYIDGGRNFSHTRSYKGICPNSRVLSYGNSWGQSSTQEGYNSLKLIKIDKESVKLIFSNCFEVSWDRNGEMLGEEGEYRLADINNDGLLEIIMHVIKKDSPEEKEQESWSVYKYDKKQDEMIGESHEQIINIARKKWSQAIELH